MATLPVAEQLAQAIAVPQQIQDIGKRFEKDAARVALFTLAVVLKSAELTVAKDAAGLKAFSEDAVAVLGSYAADAARIGNPQKWSVNTLFHSGDPFHDDRERMRAFGHKWNLTPEFIAAMG